MAGDGDMMEPLDESFEAVAARLAENGVICLCRHNAEDHDTDGLCWSGYCTCPKFRAAPNQPTPLTPRDLTDPVVRARVWCEENSLDRNVYSDSVARLLAAFAAGVK